MDPYFVLQVLEGIFGKVHSSRFIVDMSLGARFTGALVMLLLYTYQYFAENSFQLLNCVHVKSEHYSVLFIDANMYCYQDWQWGFLAFACIYVFPFSVVLAYAPALLRWRAISAGVFIISLIFPLPSAPFLVFMFYKHRGQKRKTRKERMRNTGTLGTADVIANIISEPYTNRYWESGLLTLFDSLFIFAIFNGLGRVFPKKVLIFQWEVKTFSIFQELCIRFACYCLVYSADYTNLNGVVQYQLLM